MLFSIFSRLMSLVKIKNVNLQKYADTPTNEMLWKIEDNFFNFPVLKSIITELNARPRSTEIWLAAHHDSIDMFNLSSTGGNLKVFLAAEYALSLKNLSWENWLQIYKNAYCNIRLSTLARKQLFKANLSFTQWQQILLKEAAGNGRLSILAMQGMFKTANALEELELAANMWYEYQELRHKLTYRDMFRHNHKIAKARSQHKPS